MIWLSAPCSTARDQRNSGHLQVIIPHLSLYASLHGMSRNKQMDYGTTRVEKWSGPLNFVRSFTQKITAGPSIITSVKNIRETVFNQLQLQHTILMILCALKNHFSFELTYFSFIRIWSFLVFFHVEYPVEYYTLISFRNLCYLILNMCYRNYLVLHIRSIQSKLVCHNSIILVNLFLNG